MKEKSILIVEDDFVLAQNTKYILLTVGYKIISIARSSTEALEFIKNSPPSIILMDINLGEEIDGIQLATNINSSHKIPIVFLTANYDSSTIERTKSTSTFGYLLKPVDAQELKITIEIVLHKHKLEQDLYEQKNSLTQAFNAISDGIITIDEKGNTTFLNDSALLLFQLNTTFIHCPFSVLLNNYLPKGHQQFKETHFLENLQEKNQFELELLVKKEILIVTIVIEKIQFSNQSSFLITINDITDLRKEEESRKLIEESLLLNERKFFDLVHNLPISITRFLIDTKTYEFSNQAFEDQFGAPIDVLRDLNPQERLAYIHGDDLPNVIESYTKWANLNYKGVMTLDYRGYNYNKEHLWLKNFLYADFNENNQPYALNQIGVDVSNLKNAEIALTKALRNDLRTTVQNLLNLVIRLRKENNSYSIIFCDGLLSKELGVTVDEAVLFNEHFSDNFRKAILPSIEHCFNGKSVQNEIFYNDRYILFWFQPIIENSVVNEIVGSAVDITTQKEVEHQLRENEQLQSLLIELLPIGVIQYSFYTYDTNESFVFERTNGVLLKLLEIDALSDLHRNILRENMTEKSLTEYLHLIHQWDNRNDGSVFKMNVQIVTKSTSVIKWVQIHQTKYQISEFQSRYISVFIDISKEKKDELRLKHLASFAEQTPMIIVEVDFEMKLFYINPYAIIRFPSLEQEGILHRIFKNIEFLKSSNFPLIIETELDQIVFEQTVFYIEEAGVFRIFSYEITSRKEIERELIKTLEKERELVSLQNQFVTTVSHEFRTPLTGILTSCELLEMYSQKMTQDQLNSEIAKIKSRVEDLTKLMNNFIVQSSKLSLKDRFNPQIHEFNNFITRILEDNKSSFETKNISVRFSSHAENIYVLIDESMIRQSVQNIISNSVLYSTNNSTIIISLDIKDTIVTLKISDNGIGIPEKEIENIFSPFFRASNTSKISGSGLGLSLAKEFIDINEGQISVTSSTEEGTSVTILFASTSSNS